MKIDMEKIYTNVDVADELEIQVSNASRYRTQYQIAIGRKMTEADFVELYRLVRESWAKRQAKNEAKLLAVRQAGRRAYEAGKGVTENPYLTHTCEPFWAWYAGWLDGKDEAGKL